VPRPAARTVMADCSPSPRAVPSAFSASRPSRSHRNDSNDPRIARERIRSTPAGEVAMVYPPAIASRQIASIPNRRTRRPSLESTPRRPVTDVAPNRRPAQYRSLISIHSNFPRWPDAGSSPPCDVPSSHVVCT
jgi:hypothetical protein